MMIIHAYDGREGPLKFFVSLFFFSEKFRLPFSGSKISSRSSIFFPLDFQLSAFSHTNGFQPLSVSLFERATRILCHFFLYRKFQTVIFFHLRKFQTVIFFHLRKFQTVIFFHLRKFQTVIFFRSRKFQTLIFFHLRKFQTVIFFKALAETISPGFSQPVNMEEALRLFVELTTELERLGL